MRNLDLVPLLIIDYSLCSRNDSAIACGPLQTLIWKKSENGQVLVPRNPPLQNKTGHLPWGLVDMLKDDMGSSRTVTWRGWSGSIASTEADQYYILNYIVYFS